MLQEIYIRALEQDQRAWRIDSLGELAYPNLSYRRMQPSIQIAMSPIIVDLNDNEALTSITASAMDLQKRSWSALGTLPLLQVGDIWQSGKFVLRPNYQQETFSNLQIDQGTTTLVKTGLSIGDKDFLLPLREHPWHRAHTQAFCIKITLAEERQLLIPCWELIRFYFGSSSPLLNKLFSYTLNKSMLYSSSSLKAGLHLHLTLADTLPGSSAADIGRIALDPHAWRAALRIGTSCLRAATQSEAIFPSTFFPFEGKTTLVASGRWVSLGTREKATFIVYGLQSCSHPFPFKSLRYECSQKKGKNTYLTKNRSNEYTNTPNTIYQKKDVKAPVRITDEDSNKNLTPTAVRIHNQQRFPDLERKQVFRMAAMEFIDHSETVVIDENGGIEFHATGESIASGKVRPVEFSLASISRQSDAQKAGIPMFLRDILHGFEDKGICKVKLFYPADSTSPILNLPKVIESSGEINPICYHVMANGKHRPRRAALLEISDSSNDRVLIIFEGECAGKPGYSLDLSDEGSVGFEQFVMPILLARKFSSFTEMAEIHSPSRNAAIDH